MATHAGQRSSTKSRTSFVSARPRVAFITSPMIAPGAATLPPWIFSATSVCVAASVGLFEMFGCEGKPVGL